MAKDYSKITQKKALAIVQNHRGNTASIQTTLYGSSSSFNTEIDHNYRATKKACLSSVNKKGIYSYDGINKPVHRKNESKWAKAESAKLKALYKPHQANHRVLILENGTKNTRFNNPEVNGQSKDIKQSFAESILFFGGKQKATDGSLIKESHLQKLIDKHGEKAVAQKLVIISRSAMEVIAKKYNFELIGDTTIHMDEQGQLHAHQMHTNYDKDNGSSPNFSTRIGAELQTIVAHEFKQLGFKRGVPKAIQKIAGLTPRGNIPIQAYKELAQRDAQSQELITKLNRSAKALSRKAEKLEKQLSKLSSQIEKGEGIISKSKVSYWKNKHATLSSKLETTETAFTQLEAKYELALIKIESHETTNEMNYEKLKIRDTKVAKIFTEKHNKAIVTNTKQVEQLTRKAVQEHIIEPLNTEIRELKTEVVDLKDEKTSLNDKLFKSQKDGAISAQLVNKFTSIYGVHDWVKESALGMSTDASNIINLDFNDELPKNT